MQCCPNKTVFKEENQKKGKFFTSVFFISSIRKNNLLIRAGQSFAVSPKAGTPLPSGSTSLMKSSEFSTSVPSLSMTRSGAATIGVHAWFRVWPNHIRPWSACVICAATLHQSSRSVAFQRQRTFPCAHTLQRRGLLLASRSTVGKCSSRFLCLF